MPKSGGYRKHMNVLRAGTGSYQGTERKGEVCERDPRGTSQSRPIPAPRQDTLDETEPTTDTQSYSHGEELSESQL